MLTKYLYIISFLLLFLAKPCYAQNTSEDIRTLEEKIKSHEQLYASNEALLNGIVYVNPYINYIGNPYYMEQALKNCTLFSKSIAYHNKVLLFDIINQELILEIENSFGGKENLGLQNGLIDSVYLNGSLFIYDKRLNSYLELVAETKDFRLMLCHKKHVKLSKTELNHEIALLDPEVYLFIGDERHRIRGRRNLLKLVSKNNKKILRQTMRKMNFSIRRLKSFDNLSFLSKISTLR